MKKRKTNKVVRFLGMITILCSLYFFILFPMGWMVFYSNPSTANEPGIEVGSYAMASNLVDMDYMDFIVFNFQDDFFGKYEKVSRLVAKEGDTVQLKDGVFYRNGKNGDQDLSLKFAYEISELGNEQLVKQLLEHKEVESTVNPDSSYSLFIEDGHDLISEHQLRRKKDGVGYIDETILKQFGKPWNKDHFGPIVVPKGKLFVLGDNRDFSEDSRFIGCIDEEDVKGVLCFLF